MFSYVFGSGTICAVLRLFLGVEALTNSWKISTQGIDGLRVHDKGTDLKVGENVVSMSRRRRKTYLITIKTGSKSLIMWGLFGLADV